MKVLSLFSGGGLGDYGLELAGMEIVGQVEIDEYCQKILKLRWPEVPKWGDIKEVDSSDLLSKIGRPDIICGGFPCQDISVAGRGVGIKGERSGLWKEMLRIIREARPRYVLVENVTALLGRGLGVVLGDLASIGYDCEWDCIPASAVGAPHQRDRVWIVAYARLLRSAEHEVETMGSKQLCEGGYGLADADSQRKKRQKLRTEPDASRCGEDVADTDKKLRQRCGRTRNRRPESSNSGQIQHAQSYPRRIFDGERPKDGNFWAVEPNVGRVAHGVAKRVDRLKLLGNGQVVQVVQWIGERIMKFDSNQ